MIFAVLLPLSGPERILVISDLELAMLGISLLGLTLLPLPSYLHHVLLYVAMHSSGDLFNVRFEETI